MNSMWAPRSSWSMTTTPSRSTTSSRRSCRVASSGNIWKQAPTYGVSPLPKWHEETIMAERSETLTQQASVPHQDLAPWQRLPMLVLGFVSLLLGLLAGEARIGWSVPLPRPDLIMLHGPLMVSGFLGTLIGLERSVAIGRRFLYLGPAASAAGAVLLIAGAPVTAGA